MELKNFGISLNENKKKNISKRLMEMRQLHKPADDIILEFTPMFSEDSNGKIEATKMLLGENSYIKHFVGKDVESTPKKDMEKLRNRYSQYMTMREFNELIKISNQTIVEELTKRIIERG